MKPALHTDYNKTIEHLSNFQFTFARNTRLQAHFAVLHAQGESFDSIANKFKVTVNSVRSSYRAVCRRIYWMVTRDVPDESIQDGIHALLHEQLFRNEVGAGLIDKYYNFIYTNEIENPEKYRNWLDEEDAPKKTNFEVHQDKIDFILKRLETRFNNVTKQAQDDYMYLTTLIKQITEVYEDVKPVPTKPRYNMMASQNLVADYKDDD